MRLFIPVLVMILLLACSLFSGTGQSVVTSPPIPTVTTFPKFMLPTDTPVTLASSTQPPTLAVTHTITPTTTGTATFEPTYTPEPTSSSTQALRGFKILSFSQAVQVGSIAKLRIETAPGATCKLTYSPPKYYESNLGEGLQKANADGICYWTWTVGYKPGTGKIRIFANGYGETYEIYIYES